MEHWTVQDRNGREIYLTQVEWEDHILAHHPELAGLLDEVLATIHSGQRKQDRIRPNKYFYRRRSDLLPGNFTHIVVVVLFKPQNNYVVAAWPTS
ncbi:MAG: hypothetical protein H6658_20140 [Ardenticatenaceae bacterium]|nr:hypothetical protein [Ardenticatenaceae bacterium]